MEKTKVTKDLENKKLVIERTFEVPKEKLWSAYADKDTFVSWWGPEGWETTVKEFDFRPGGRNHYGMKCVDENQGEWFGQESWGLMEYQAVDAPNSFTYKDYFANPDGSVQENMPVMTATLDLVEQDGKTVLVSTIVAESAEDIEKLLAMGMLEGFESSCKKLEQMLSTNE